MNRSDIFKAAHRSTKFELTGCKFTGLTYAQVFRIILKRVCTNRRVEAQNKTTFRVKIAYKDVNLRNLLKAKKAIYDSQSATWVLNAKAGKLGILANYVIPFGR
jgi:UDP-N-acetyl-D-mannosaminuronic acid transferase (WecB/TagA/CpsF family)